MEMKKDRYGRPRVYLEEDCPVEELSVESQRERGASSALPPLYFLHVWWARRPLTISRASLIGSLLPAGYDKKDFLNLIGVQGDPVSARNKIDRIKAGIEQDTPGNKYGYPRAFSNPISERTLSEFHSSLIRMWGEDTVTVLDNFAGGGSIPFEACRLGLQVISNDLNPVATLIQKASIEYPIIFGSQFVKDIDFIGKSIEKELEIELRPFFPCIEGEYDHNYIWVRTIMCNKCNLVIPLSPNWHLDKLNGLVFVPIVPPINTCDVCQFVIQKNIDGINPDKGTIKRGICSCPRCGNVMDGGFIKNEASAGRLGSQMAVIQSIRVEGKRRVKKFREVTELDMEGFVKAKDELARRKPDWSARGLVPTEEIPEGKETKRMLDNGLTIWYQMFNDRQLLVHLSVLDKILSYPWKEISDEKRRNALRLYLQLAFDKCIDYNSLQSRMHSIRLGMVNTFDRHDFAFVWSYGEIDGAGNLFRFGYSQISDAYSGLAKLLQGAQGTCTFLNGDAANLLTITNRSIHLISTDPPYYDNVMYSECSDYFYVWMKRGLGDFFPELFSSELTDKAAEAVANPSQFKGAGRGMATGLAAKDYEAKMLSSFKEMYRVLRDDGVMTVMFTHKKVEAWDTMAQALLEAGFMITASWPIHTESEHSLHQAKKNAAASTILLVCRKRPEESKTSWWDEVQVRVDDEVRRKAEEFSARGLRGQDTFIACFGPALQVISENWPVKRKDGTVIRPDEALDRARTTVSAWFMDNIAEGKAETLDASTRFYILAWYLFGAREFRYDEARKLGISLNVEVEDLTRAKIMEKKGDFVRFLKPQDRAKKKGLRTDVKEYDNIIDLVQAAMFAYSEGQSAELKLFHQRTGALAIKGYKQAIEYLLDVLPRTAEVEEYATLDAMWESNYRDIKRRVRNTNPTGEKQGRLDQFVDGATSSDDELEEGDEQ